MIDDQIRQFLPPERQQGARVAATRPTKMGPTRHRIGDDRPLPDHHQALVESKVINEAGVAHTETGNAWSRTPQLAMELGDWSEQVAYVSSAGAIAINPNVANCWRINLTGDATITLIDPAALPQDQIDAGRNRNTSTGIMLLIARNGHHVSFSGAWFPAEEAAQLVAGANFDLLAFQWWGGPSAAPFWIGKVCASGLSEGMSV